MDGNLNEESMIGALMLDGITVGNYPTPDAAKVAARLARARDGKDWRGVAVKIS